MNMKLYMVYVASLVMFACSGADVSGSSDDPSVLTAEKSSSSSSVDTELSSSSKNYPVLCKASGSWGWNGCLRSLPSGSGDLWSNGDRKVKTSAYADDPSKFGNRAGEFFYETDSVEGGATELYWFDVYDKRSTFENSIFNVLVKWNKGNLPYEVGHDPYFNIGFYVAGFDSNGVAMSADISNWNGMCFVYSGTTNPTLLLDLGDSINKKLGYVLPSVTLIAQEEPQCFEWKDFKQSASDKEHGMISGEEAAKHVEKIILHFQAKPREAFGDYANIRVLAVGTNRIDPNQSSSSSVQRSSSSESDPCMDRGGKDCVVSGHGDLWSPGERFVDTRLYTDGTSKYGNDKSGLFFFEDNSEKGAEIEYEWHSTYGIVYGDISNPPDLPIDSLSIGVLFGKGYVDNSLFSDVGFYVAGFDTNGEMLSADIQNWNGICVVANYEYAGGDVSLSMQLDLGDSLNSKIGGALPEVALASSESTQCFEWNQFKQPDTDKEHEIISGEEAAKHVAKVKFHIQAYPDNSIVILNILAIGSNRNE